MDENKKQENRRFFHPEATLVPVSDCYDYVMYPNGLMAGIKGHRSAGNEKILLYFLTRHMSQETPEGETTEFKDVAQAFWGKHEYISERTGLSNSRISEAITSLVKAGILVHHVERGVCQHIAFSNQVIDAWVEYSRVQAISRLERTSGKRKQAVPVTGSGQFRSPEAGSSVHRKQAVPVSGSSSYIEDPVIGFRGSDPATDSVDGWREDSQPANRALISIAQEFQKIFQQRSSYIDYATINFGLIEIVAEADGDIQAAWKFTKWAQEYVLTFIGSKGLKWKDPKMAELIRLYREEMRNSEPTYDPQDHSPPLNGMESSNFSH